MTSVPVTRADDDNSGEPLTLPDLDATVGSSPEVPVEENAVRYYSDEALLVAIRRRRNGRAAD